MTGAEVVLGSKGGRLLKYNGFIYRAQVRFAQKTRWSCEMYRQTLCRAALWEFADGHFETRNKHNHRPSPQEYDCNASEQTTARTIPGTVSRRPVSVDSSRGGAHGVTEPPPLGSSNHLVSARPRDRNSQETGKRKVFCDENEHGTTFVNSDGGQMSVSESLKLQPRKRRKLYRTDSDEDDRGSSDDQGGSSPPDTPSCSNVSLVDKWEPNEEYEVEAIRDIIRNPDTTLKLLVKWKNWPETTNSWEPFSNTRCYEAIAKFLVERADNKYLPLVMHEYVQEKFQFPDANIYVVCKLLDLEFDLKKCLLLDFREKLRLTELLREQKRASLLRAIRKHYGNSLKFVRFIDGQQNLRLTLDELQQKFTSNTFRDPLVYFENLVDFETTPLSFSVIEDYTFADGVPPQENEESCECLDCENCSCPGVVTGSTAPGQNYTVDGRLAERVRRDRSSVFECGSRCTCLADCYNRVTQRGRPVELTVYKTGPLKKWAVRTNSSMKAWTFVLEYLGVVRRCEGETSQENFPYVFELEAGEREQPNFVVDSSQRSNVCRFINHSCNPNLITVKVFNQLTDLKIPRLAFFACRDILENEELTFDYRTMKSSLASRSRRFGFECRCQETNCCGKL